MRSFKCRFFQRDFGSSRLQNQPESFTLKMGQKARKKNQKHQKKNNGSSFLHKLDLSQMNLWFVVVKYLHNCYIFEVLRSFLDVFINSL